MTGAPEDELEMLRGASLFQGLPAAALRDILARARRVAARRDEFFFQQGDPADLIYVLAGGQVKLLQVTPEGNQALVRFVGPGQLFGGIATLGDAEYPVSAQAVTDAQAWNWSSATLAHLMEAFPLLGLNAVRHLAARVRELQQRNLELATERVERRIAHTLIRLAQASGRPVEGGVLIDLPLSRQDLAEMTGTSLYTVSRTLSAWQQQGLIEAGREKVLIRSPHGLVAIAEDLPPPGRAAK